MEKSKQTKKVTDLRENPSVFYGRCHEMYKMEEKVLDNGAIVLEPRQLSPEEILDNAKSVNVIGDALEQSPSMHNNYRDTFSDYDSISHQIDSAEIKIEKEIEYEK